MALDTLMHHIEPGGSYVSVWADGDYTTNIPLVDLLGGKAWLVHTFAGEPLAPEHGGPARLHTDPRGGPSMLVRKARKSGPESVDFGRLSGGVSQAV